MSAMRRALVATGVALALLLVGPLRARAQQAAAAETDPWFGHDKALHFAASGSLALVGYAGASLATERRPTRVVVAASFALGLGIAKEVWDLTGHGDASWRDLTWDVVGTTAGVLIAYAIDRAIDRLWPPSTNQLKSPVTDP
jgi:putative lipoprotein